MGISSKKMKKFNPKEVACICKRCGRKFNYPVQTDLCKECRFEDRKKLSSAEMLLKDLDF